MFKKHISSKRLLQLRDAAILGDAEAQLELGIRYRWGCGVQADSEKALIYLRLAAEQGHAEAQYELSENFFALGPHQPAAEVTGHSSAPRFAAPILRLPSEQAWPPASSLTAPVAC
jgi:TPR repeat protein